MRKYLRWPVLLILAALVVAALVPAFSLLHQGKTAARAAHAAGIPQRSVFSPPFARMIRQPKPLARHTTAGVDRTHLPALTLLSGKIQHAGSGASHTAGVLMSASAASSATTTLFFDNFESGAPGWKTVGDSSGNNFWNLAQNPNSLAVPGSVNPLLVSYPDTAGALPNAYSGTHAWWYGDSPATDSHPTTASLTYMGNENSWPAESSHNGGTSNGANSGSLISPSIDLTTVHNATLTFATWWEIEGLNPAHFDQMFVDISTNGGNNWASLGVFNPTTNPLPVLDTSPLPNPGGPYAYPFTDNGLDAPASWQVASVNLSAYTGHTVQVRFRFNSVDQTDNGFRGWFIDDVGVYTATTSGGPKVNSISPNTGKAGDVITITGSGFGSTQGTSTITFNGVNALVKSWGTYGITAVVPQGILSGPIVVTVNGAQTAPVNFIVNANISLYLTSESPGGYGNQVSGAGFAPNEAVALYLNGVNGILWQTVQADSGGDIPYTSIGYVPDVPYGVHLVLAVGQTSRIIAGEGLLIFPSFASSVPVVAPGETVKMTGSGFTPFDTVQIQVGFFSFQNSDIGTLSCDGNGDCSGNVIVPSNPGVLQGAGYFADFDTGTGLSFGRQVTFTPGISITPVAAGPGASITVEGGAFTANESVKIYLGTTSGAPEGTATTDSSGNLYYSFQSPSPFKAGSYSIIVARTAQTPTTVAAPYTVPSPGLISTAGIHSGQSIQVQLRGFQAGESVALSWNANGGQQIGGVNVDSTGAWSGTETPPAALAGSYTLKATGNTSGLKATSSLSIGPGLLLNPNPANPGSTITVNGGGFTPGEAVKVYFQAASKGTVSATVNSAGDFTASLTIPLHYDPTVTYSIYAVSKTGTDQAKALFTYRPASIYIFPQTSYGVTAYYEGSGFAANEQVNLYWGYQQSIQKLVSTVTAAADGTIDIPVLPPSEPNIGYVNVAAIGVTSQLKAIASTREYAGIILQPADASDGATVNVKGGSFDAIEKVVLTLNRVTIGIGYTNTNGFLATTVVIPNVGASINWWVYATGKTSGIVASFDFTVDATLVLSPDTGPSGTQITVTGSNFGFNEQVTIEWYDPSTNTSTYLASATASNGAFTVTITAPKNLVSGTTYYVTSGGGSNQPGGSATFVAQ